MEQRVIEAVKVFFAFFLMTEDLYNLLAVHHFLNVAVDFTEVALLLNKIFSAQTGSFFCTDEHQADHYECDEGQRHVQNEHTHKDADDCKRAVDDLRNTLADHLAERIDIVCIDRHDVAVCVGIKIPDRQKLHMGKQIIAQIAQCSLSHGNHDAVVSIR